MKSQQHRTNESPTILNVDTDERKAPYLRRWLIWALIFYSIALCYFAKYSIPVETRLPLFFIEDKLFNTARSGFLIDTSGCRIPDLDAFDPLIRQYLSKIHPLNCSETPLFVNSNLTALFIVNSTVSAYDLNGKNQLHCCYQSFYRVETTADDYPDNFDNLIKFNEACTSFENEVEVKEEFVQVLCTMDNGRIIKSYHAFIPLKPEVEKHCHETRETISSQIQESLSVLVVGMDAVSRLNFHRQLPQTLSLLQDLDSIELLGYNKVADNTFPNIVPVLSGLSEDELKSACWPDSQIALDKCPWIWKNFSAAGYRTGYGEDALHISLFSYKNYGFIRQPTDYYLRPFMKTTEENIGYKQTYLSKLCMGPQITLEVLLNYISKFATTLSSKHSFGFFWGTSLTHDDIDYPAHADELYNKFITQLNATGSINQTVLILMSDHGIRWGKIREIYQGRLEERLPYIFFVFPKWFKQLYPEAIANLRRNVRRLTSPFDIYKTLLDLIDLHKLDRVSIRRRTSELSNVRFKPRGISLFLPIHNSRTCKEAGITPHWCTCQMSTTLSPNDTLVKHMALFLVEHLNSLVKLYRGCSKLQLVEVRSARIEVPIEDLYDKTSDQGLRDYVLIVRTTPGDGLFEATIRHLVGTNTISVPGFVSRINTYGNQSACIADYHMKLYCFCRL